MPEVLVYAAFLETKASLKAIETREDLLKGKAQYS